MCTMKKLMMYLLLLLNTVLSLSSFAQEPAIIVGEVENCSASKITLSSANWMQEVDLNNGHFYFNFLPDSTVSIYTLTIDSTDIPLYLTSGNRLNIQLDQLKPVESVEFNGRTALESSLLLELFQAITENDMQARLSLKKDQEFIEANNRDYSKMLENVCSRAKKIDPNFLCLVERNVHFLKQTERLYFSMINSDSTEFNIPICVSNQCDLNNPQFIQLPNFGNFLTTYLSYESSENSAGRLTENFRLVDSLVTNVQVKEFAQYLLILDEIEYFGLSAKTIELYNEFNTKTKNQVYQNQLKKAYGKWNTIAKDELAPDIAALNKEGKEVHLHDLRGKVVYIDTWATWCRPCAEEMPYLNEIKEHYANNDDVIILGISIDNDMDLWKKYLERKNMNGEQWRVEGGFESQYTSDYLVKSIPRFILIDKEGKIVEASAPKPSHKETLISKIDSLL